MSCQPRVGPHLVVGRLIGYPSLQILQVCPSSGERTSTRRSATQNYHPRDATPSQFVIHATQRAPKLSCTRRRPPKLSFRAERSGVEESRQAHQFTEHRKRDAASAPGSSLEFSLAALYELPINIPVKNTSTPPPPTRNAACKNGVSIYLCRIQLITPNSTATTNTATVIAI